MMTEGFEHFDLERIPYFVCIGTSRSTIDMVAPCIGTILDENNFEVIGTEDDNLHALNMWRKTKILDKLDKTRYQVIAIDAAVSSKQVSVNTFPVQPGKAMKKILPKLGEISIHVSILYDLSPEEQLEHIINNTGSEEETRRLANVIAHQIIKMYRK